MEISEFLGALRKRWVTILVVTVLGVAVAAAAVLLSPLRYTATSRMYVAVQLGESVSDLQTGTAYTNQAVYSYADVATAPVVLEPVIADLDLAMTPAELADTITVDVRPETVILEITAESGSPVLAAEIANAVTTELSGVISDLVPDDAAGRDVIQSLVVEEAQPPADASSPRPVQNVALGLLGGLAVGLLLAVLRETTNTRIRTEEDLAHLTDTALIGAMGYDRAATKHPVFVRDAPTSAAAEAVRRLRTNLRFLRLDHRHASIVVTSSTLGEGKTTTAVNLALSLAAADRSVLLVDADLRRPAIAKRLGLESSAGLTTVLIGDAPVTEVVQQVAGSRLDVLTSGVIPPNPGELLSSRAMAVLLAELTESYDVVVVDTPPLGPVADAAAVATHADGVVVVAAAHHVRKSQLRHSLTALRTVEATVLGVVLNKTRDTDGEHGYYATDERPAPAPSHPAAAAGDTARHRELAPAGE